MKNSYITHNPDETQKLASRFAGKLYGGEVICLYGDLGAGKTVFVQGILQSLLPSKRVLSPTFIIVRHYQINHTSINRFLHIDLYRMSTEKDIGNLEFFEFMHKSDTVIAIEWAEKLQNLLPKERIDIHIKNIDDAKRRIEIDYVKS